MKRIRCPKCGCCLEPFYDGKSLFLICSNEIECGLEFEWENLEERKQLKLKSVEK